jgi:hypothetical protein
VPAEDGRSPHARAIAFKKNWAERASGTRTPKKDVHVRRNIVDPEDALEHDKTRSNHDLPAYYLDSTMAWVRHRAFGRSPPS